MLLFSTVIVFTIGIVFSIYYNSVFIFVFIPFGLGWTFSRKSEARSELEEKTPKENPQI